MPIARILAFLPFLALGAMAQVEPFPRPWKNNAIWSVDTLFIGASFVRREPGPMKVWLKGNEAGWVGELSAVADGGDITLVVNHDPPGTSAIIPDSLGKAIGDTVNLAYRVTTPENQMYPSAQSRLPKYTGANQPGASRYVSLAANPKYGHRWCVSGTVNDSIVEFGFEDNVEASSDFDFDDIVFRTNLGLAKRQGPVALRDRERTMGKAQGLLKARGRPVDAAGRKLRFRRGRD